MAQIFGAVFFLAFAPGFFWLWYVYSKDRYAPEPVSLVGKVFLFGILSVIPAIILEKLIPVIFPAVKVWETSGSPIEATLYYILAIGVVEEFCKLLPVWLFIYRNSEFNEVLDGIIYASSAALGFACIENVLYIFSYGPHVMVGRAVLSTLGHVLFSMFWGLGLGLAKFNPRHSKYIVIVGFIIASVIHGIFNVFAISSQTLLLLILVFVIWRIFLIMVEKSKLLSPFRYRWTRRLLVCPSCKDVSRQFSKYCGNCGKAIEALNDFVFFCGNCHKEINKDTRYCPQCEFFLINPK